MAISLGSLIVWKLFYCNPITNNISLALFVSGLFAFLIELGNYFFDRRRFSYLIGPWKRTHFFNRNEQNTGTGYRDESEHYNSRVHPIVNLTYHEDGEYHGKVTYAKGEVEFIIYINKNNPLSGSGTYQYTMPKTQQEIADLGYYDFIVDISKSKIYISHQNKLPSGNAKGIEIWQRI